MRRYLHPVAWVLSFFSMDLYRDVAQNWRGVGLLYLLGLVTICQIPSLAKLQYEISRFAHGEGGALADQIPPISIRDGVAHVNAPQPVLIRVAGHGSVIAVVDTTGQFSSLDQTEAKLLITSNRVYLRRRPGDMRMFDLARVERFDVDRVLAHRWLSRVETWCVVLFAPLMIVAAFAFRVVQVLVFSIIGLLFAPGLKARLNYPQLMRLTTVAITPMLVINTIRSAIGAHVPYWSILSALLLAVYVVASVKASARRAGAEEGEESATPGS